MKLENKALELIIRSLSKCLAGEAEAIARRDFPAIADFAQKKIGLTGEFEKAFEAAAEAPDETLKSALREMQQMAQENAVRLEHLRDGAARARVRIQELIAEKSRVGVYQAKGLPLRARAFARKERTA